MTTTWLKVAFLVTMSLMLLSCGPSYTGPYAEVSFETRGDPITLQRLSGGNLEPGLYRYVDKGLGVVVYVVSGFASIVGVTSQRIGK